MGLSRHDRGVNIPAFAMARIEYALAGDVEHLHQSREHASYYPVDFFSLHLQVSTASARLSQLSNDTIAAASLLYTVGSDRISVWVGMVLEAIRLRLLLWLRVDELIVGRLPAD